MKAISSGPPLHTAGHPLLCSPVQPKEGADTSREQLSSSGQSQVPTKGAPNADAKRCEGVR